MATGTLVSVHEYLTASYRPDCDYVDGVIVERNVGEHDHSRLQIRLGGYLLSRERQCGIHALTEQRVQVKPTRFRVPDLCVVLAAASYEPIFKNPPFLCIEILSKDDGMSDMQERINDYLALGVNYVWVLDPRTRRAFVCTPGQMRECTDGVLRTAAPEIVVPLAELFD